jgi:hemerythrin-like metal-binding protein
MKYFSLVLLIVLLVAACSKNADQKQAESGKMILLEWSDNLSIKVKEIDNQHKALVGLLNDLHDASMSNKDRATQGALLDKIIAETANHFQTEEKYMDQYAFSGLEEHKKIHADFVKICLDLQAKYKAGTANIDMPTLDMIKKWLGDHISTKDTELGKFLVSKGMS